MSDILMGFLFGSLLLFFYGLAKLEVTYYSSIKVEEEQ